MSVGNLVVKTNADGSRVLLRDVAVIRDGLEERLSEWHHNGETAQGWEIHAEKDSVEVARRVKGLRDRNEYPIATRSRADHLVGRFPGLRGTDRNPARGRLDRLRTRLPDIDSFLHVKVAIWAGIGILTSIFGTFWLDASTGRVAQYAIPVRLSPGYGCARG